MINETYAEFAWEQAAKLLSIDSPSGFTAKAAAWVRSAFADLGFSAGITTKAACSLTWEALTAVTVCSWKPIRIRWAA